MDDYAKKTMAYALKLRTKAEELEKLAKWVMAVEGAPKFRAKRRKRRTKAEMKEAKAK